MKVKIGKPKKWIGSYQIAEFICFWERWLPDTEEDRLSDKLGNLLAYGNLKGEGKSTKFHNWLEKRYASKKDRVIVEIHPHDTWDLSHTLSLIILPSLRQLKDERMSSAIVDDKDIYDWSSLGDKASDHDKWDYVLEEMIWAFEEVALDYNGEDKFYLDGVDKEGLREYYDRIDRGLALFGKYYRNLWS